MQGGLLLNDSLRRREAFRRLRGKLVGKIANY